MAAKLLFQLSLSHLSEEHYCLSFMLHYNAIYSSQKEYSDKRSDCTVIAMSLKFMSSEKTALVVNENMKAVAQTFKAGGSHDQANL